MAEGEHDYRLGDDYQDEPRGSDIPVNPYSLLEAVNDASAAARAGWVAFLAIMTYLLIAVAGVTHRDLLLNNTVDLPLLQVGIDLVRFFLFAPVLLVFLHFGTLVQHVMLARKVLEFDTALRPLESTNKRTHPLRLELHSYFFSQALAGPERSWLFGVFLHAMSWLSLVVIPVLLALFIQVMFLPYHDTWITWSHRVLLVVDILVLLAIGVFLRRPETSFWRAFYRNARYHPLTFVITSLLLVATLMFSFFVATIPDENLDKLTRTLPGFSQQSTLTSATSDQSPRDVFMLTGLLFEGGTGEKGKFNSPFSRNLVVADQDLVPDRDEIAGEVSLNLRDRDLRYAVLDRSDLHRADLTGSNLEGASFIGTDLRRTKLSCSDINAVLTLEISRAEGCTQLTGANFTRAVLNGADLRLGFLGGAKFQAAKMIGADLRYSDLSGADFSGADMRRADLSGGAELMGSNFLGALLQGADLSGAKLHGADFSSAALQGAQFTLVQAYGANFQGAELDAANFAFARLYGTDLTGATLRGADLSAANVWQSVPPGVDDIRLADLAGVKLKAPSPRDIRGLEELLVALQASPLRKRLEDATAALRDAGASKAWATSNDARGWQNRIDRSAQEVDYDRQLTAYLAGLSCQVRWGDASVATGAVQRALSPTFKGDIKEIYQRLSNPSCPASSGISTDLMLRLAAAVERKQGLEPAPLIANGTAAPVVGTTTNPQ